MFKSFEDLLEKTQGYPEERKADLKNMADTLEAIGVLSKVDLQKEVQEILEGLPEIRQQRAQTIREAAQGLPEAEKAIRLEDADRLDASADKLKLPDVNEQFKNRAILTELSLRLRSKVAGIDRVVSELDPARLEKFKAAMQHSEQALPHELPTADRHQAALYAFATELRATGFQHVDQAVDNFYQNAIGPERQERGHFGDVSFHDTEGVNQADNLIPGGLHTQDYLTRLLQEQDQAEHLDRVKHNKLLINLPGLAAEHLKPKEYAAFRVMIENEHLLDWKLESGKVVMKARTLNAGDPENTMGKILQRELDYQHVRGANITIKQTIQKMNGLLMNKDDLVPSPKAAERMQKTTREVLRDAKKKGPER